MLKWKGILKNIAIIIHYLIVGLGYFFFAMMVYWFITLSRVFNGAVKFVQ